MSLPEDAIAIIGLAGRFPGANDVDQFWRNIRNGVSSVTRFSDAELEDSFPNDVRSDANFVRARPILDNVDLFDADFFGMLPREAALTDPQHRVLLECAWVALEDGGYDPSRFPGAIGVFAGCSMNTYLLTNVLGERLDRDRFASDYQVGSYDALLGSLSDTLATRISYKLNLRGPAMTVQSACSTSLLAISQACQSLLLYQSDMALAGGVSITFPQKRGYLHQEGGMVSPDGVCRPFDADAGGTIFGDGAAIVLLKRLGDAIDDGDRIYAVIRGSAVNNDGSDKVGFTAPSIRGQAEVIASALAASNVEANSIGYVECHGTATPLGDPIEFAGLVGGFGSNRVGRPYCALGSVKANVGHLDVASGAAGLIKAALALYHREIPPLANFHKPNPHIDSVGSPFYFPTAPVSWPEGPAPRRAGVSSFGVGGTNVHIVLEQAPPIVRADETTRRRHVLPLSARNDAALASAAAALADDLVRNTETTIEDVAYTLQAGRRAFEHRVAVTCSSREQAIAALRALPKPASGTRAPLIFMFPGQGAQYPGMASVLYGQHASFRATIDEGIDITSPIVGPELRAQLLEPDATGGDATLLTQPALFIFEYALARLWISWGLKPDAMVGHSVGEFVAACLSGVFSFEDGCRIVATRARIMQGMVPGGMLAVRLSEPKLRAELGDALDLAAINAPSLCVASGPIEAIEALDARLTAKGVACRRLAVSHDIVIGVPIAGQGMEDEPNLVGHCVQMLPFRIPLAWDAPFNSHLRRVAQRLLDGFDHPKCTYGTLVRALPLQRTTNRLPLTEVQFNLERLPDALDFGGPAVVVSPNAKAAVNFDLFVNVIESGAGLRIDCDYNTGLFDEATIARWMAHYRRVLEGICAAPETSLSSLPLLSAEQERFILDICAKRPRTAAATTARAPPPGREPWPAARTRSTPQSGRAATTGPCRAPSPPLP